MHRRSKVNPRLASTWVIILMMSAMLLSASIIVIVVTDAFRLTPSITHLVKNDGLSAWAIDMNAHYVFKLSEMFGFYPLAGLSLSFGKQVLGMQLVLEPISA